MDAGCNYLKGAPPTTINKRVLLTTAMVTIASPSGNGGFVRALTDPGSQVNLITEHAVNVLNLPTRPTNVAVSGLGGQGVDSGKEAKLWVQAHFIEEGAWNCIAMVLPQLTVALPDEPILLDEIPNFPQNITLVDPHLDTPLPIDLILGVQLYTHIIKDGIRRLNNGRFLLQNSELGWLVMGQVPAETPTSELRCLVSIAELDKKK